MHGLSLYMYCFHFFSFNIHKLHARAFQIIQTKNAYKLKTINHVLPLQVTCSEIYLVTTYKSTTINACMTSVYLGSECMEGERTKLYNQRK